MIYTFSIHVFADQPVFPTTSSFTWGRPSFEGFRSSMPTFPGFLFPPIPSAFPLPVTTTNVQHQLLMKALTNKTSEQLETGEVYSGKYALSTQVKEENASNQSDGEDGSQADLSPTLQCHLCLKQFPTNSALKNHVVTDHKDGLTSPGLSHYKMMSPVRKLSTESTSNQGTGLQNQSDNETYGGKNMCGTCGKSFRDSQSLKFHRYNHVLRYQCNYCGKRFSRSWNLHRHRKTHYRQLQEAGLGTDEVNPIDVDNENGNQTTPTYEVDKDLILTSPYIDYRNHRHDMMPFAFDMRKTAPTCTYGSEDGKAEDGSKGEGEKSPVPDEIEQNNSEEARLKNNTE